MDSLFQDGNEIKSYTTINPNPYKFTIENFDDADLFEDGTQASYLINYTYGNLSLSDEGYTFTVTDGYSPDLVGHDIDEFDIVLKYVSEYDLISYGATPVETDELVEVGERQFTWDPDLETQLITDKYGQESAPLYDLDGNKITTAGWYDFTRRTSTDFNSVEVLDDVGNVIGFEQVEAWKDGGRFIYADYYSEDYGVDEEGNTLITAGSWVVTTESDTEDLPKGVTRRLIGLELNFTDNEFGDKDVKLNTIVDPFGTGATDGGSSRFTSNFTSDLDGDGDISGQPLDAGFKQVPITAEVTPPGFKSVPIDSQVIDSSQKAVPIDAIVLEDNQIAVPADLVVPEEIPENTFTSDVDPVSLLTADQIAVPADSVILRPDQIAVPADSVVLSPEEIAVSKDSDVLEEGQRAIPEQRLDVDTEFIDATAGSSQSTGDYQQPPSISSPRATGVDASGTSEMTSMKLGDDASGVGNGDGNGDGSGSSDKSGVGQSMDEPSAPVEESEGDGDGDVREQRGQGADGQGAGTGGDAALGEDQSPTTQRKRGLMLQPIVDNGTDTEEAKSSSKLLKNLSEGSVMGTNLLDALTLGGGILYALYAPQLVKPVKRSFGSLFMRLTGKSPGTPVERNIATVFAMKLPNGTQRLIAARVTTQAIDILAQQDLPADVNILKSGSQTQIDFSFKQLLEKLSGSAFDTILVGPRLRNQASLTKDLTSDVQILDTSSLESKVKSCSDDQLKQLQQWLDKPSSTPLDSNPVKDYLSDRQSDYAKSFISEQATMASMVELSVALSWKDS